MAISEAVAAGIVKTSDMDSSASAAKNAGDDLQVVRRAAEKPIDRDAVKEAVSLAKSGTKAGLGILDGARSKIECTSEPAARAWEREMGLCIACGIIHDYYGAESPRQVLTAASRFLAAYGKFSQLSYIIYKYSDVRSDLAIQEFAGASTESVAKEIVTDRTAAEKPDLSPLICFAAFGSDRAFKIVSDELIRQGRWYDLGEAARRTTEWERFK